jgi:hypothetical protein
VTAFDSRAQGRFWFQYGDAVNGFARAAELRDGYQAYDRLYLAMSYHRNGNPEKAKAEYDLAIAEMKTTEMNDAEWESLRRTTERLIAENAEPETE